MEEAKVIYEIGTNLSNNIDTALKIGFGVLVGGMISLFTLRSKQKHDNNKKQFELKKELLFEINNLSSEYFNKINSLFNIWFCEETKGKYIYQINKKWKDTYVADNISYNSRKQELEKLLINLNMLELGKASESLIKYDTEILEYRNDISNKIEPFPDSWDNDKLIESQKLKDIYQKEIRKYFKNLK